jgi:hypothetical protein
MALENTDTVPLNEPCNLIAAKNDFHTFPSEFDPLD